MIETFDPKDLSNESRIEILRSRISYDSLPSAVEVLIQEAQEQKRLLNLLLEYQQKKTPPPDEILEADEAAAFLKITKPTLYSKVSRGELPYMKRSKRLYFSRIELIDYLSEGRRQSNADIESKAEAYLREPKSKRGSK